MVTPPGPPQLVRELATLTLDHGKYYYRVNNGSKSKILHLVRIKLPIIGLNPMVGTWIFSGIVLIHLTRIIHHNIYKSAIYITLSAIY